MPRGGDLGKRVIHVLGVGDVHERLALHRELAETVGGEDLLLRGRDRLRGKDRLSMRERIRRDGCLIRV